MEAQWIIDRGYLRQLMVDHPEWTNRQYADEVGRCRKWVQKWKKRLQGTDLNDQSVLHSQSRARKTLPEPYHPEVIDRILALRDYPPPETPRKLGPVPILYYLHQDDPLKAKGYRLPRSSSTIWKILDANQRIIRQPKVEHITFERPEPMDTWEIDFTDVATAEASHDRKQAHQVEAFGVIDRGTSMLIDLQSSDDYHAKTALMAMASTLIVQGLPRCIVFDRDPRLVGSWTAEKYPSAFMRFLLCLGIQLDICPPQRPDLKPFIERYFRTLNTECVQIKHPQNAQQATEIFDEHRYIYNQHRPHQSTVCGNRPPAIAFPCLPSLPRIPETVDPNHWLLTYHNHPYKRRVDSAGRVQIDKHRYYVGRHHKGQYVVCRLDAHRQVFDVTLGNRTIKTMPIKDLFDGTLPFGDYLRLIADDAEAEQRRLARQRRLRAS